MHTHITITFYYLKATSLATSFSEKDSKLSTPHTFVQSTLISHFLAKPQFGLLMYYSISLTPLCGWYVTFQRMEQFSIKPLIFNIKNCHIVCMSNENRSILYFTNHFLRTPMPFNKNITLICHLLCLLSSFIWNLSVYKTLSITKITHP